MYTYKYTKSDLIKIIKCFYKIIEVTKIFNETSKKLNKILICLYISLLFLEANKLYKNHDKENKFIIIFIFEKPLL